MEPHQRALRILLYLAERKRDDPPNKYQICRAPKMKELGSEPTILETINQLESSKNIHVVRTDRKARGPKKSSRYYDLTPLGLANLVDAIDWDPKTTDLSLFDHLAKKYHSLLPRIFDLWQAFGDAGISDLFVKRFKELCSPSWMEVAVGERTERVPPLLLSKDALEIFLQPWWMDRTLQDRWLKGINRIESLRPQIASTIMKRVLGNIRDANEMLQAISAKEISISELESNEIRQLIDTILQSREAVAHLAKKLNIEYGLILRRKEESETHIASKADHS
jgi:DNA-binding PadR family transcriptional regulator